MFIKIFFFIFISLELFSNEIDTTKIENKIRELYEKSYDGIKINRISIYARGSIRPINSNFIVDIDNKNSLSKNGIVYIKTEDKKKIFFDYKVDAEITFYVTSQEIKKGTTLSALNTQKKSITLDKFKAMPLQAEELNDYQSKINLKENEIITLKNIESVVLVHKDSNVNVRINDQDIAISFTAEAQRDGKLGDTIMVKKSDGKKLKATVIGKNRVEVQ
ncbi:MAG: flagellar basal body P-ring formation chaperone FlgA [Sulfurimonas sp.]|jgi:flagella basal body P-ring formation protein FlgA